MKLRKPNVITAQYVIEKQETRSATAGKQSATSFPESKPQHSAKLCNHVITRKRFTMSNPTRNTVPSKELRPSPSEWVTELDTDGTAGFYYRDEEEGDFWTAKVVADPETGKESIYAELNLEDASPEEALRALSEYSEWLFRVMPQVASSLNGK